MSHGPFRYKQVNRAKRSKYGQGFEPVSTSESKSSDRYSNLGLSLLFDTKEMIDQNHLSNTGLQEIKEENKEREPITPKSMGVERRFASRLTAKLREKYRVIRKLGEGTFGFVLLGENRETRQRVAIKIVALVNEEYVEGGIDDSILAEVSILKRLDHPNIIRLYDVDYDEEQNILALVLELAQTDLRNLIKLWFAAGKTAHSNEEIQQQLQIAYDIFCGMNYLHENGILHLDFKPDNILIVNENGKLHAKIADFGLSDREDGYRLSGQTKGTWAYKAPEEQCGKKYDKNADIWSVGIMLGEMFFNTNILLKHALSSTGREELFDNFMLKYIGIPSREWYDRYVEFKTSCPPDLIDREHENTYNDLRNYFAEIYYPRDLYDQMLYLISHCLRYEPSERIQFDEVIRLPMFLNQPCNCEKCIIVAVEHIKFEAPPLYETLEELYAGKVSPELKQEPIDEQLKFQAASLSIAGKFLNVDPDEFFNLRQEWMIVAQMDYEELNQLEIEIAGALNFNFDGPFAK